MKLSNNLHFFVLLPLFNLSAADMLYLVSDDVKGPMEELSKMKPNIFKSPKL